MNSIPGLRPMTIVQILDASFRLYRENFLLFIGIMAVSLIPLMVADIISAGVMIQPLPELEGEYSESDLAHYDYENTSESLAVSMIFNLLIAFIAVPLGRGALTRAVSDRYLGAPATFRKSYGALFSILGPYLGTTLLVALGLTIAAMLCLVPFLFLFPILAFVPMVMVLEGKRGSDAMTRSMNLSAGHRWRIFGLGVLEIGLNVILNLSFGFLLDFVLPSAFDSPWMVAAVSIGASHVLHLVLEPLWTLAFILLYYDVRIRNEAFDLQVLAARSAG